MDEVQLRIFQMDDNTLLIAEIIEAPTLDPLVVHLGRSAVVRYWGTTKGRGELASQGPTAKTICDIEPRGGKLNWLHIRREIRVTTEASKQWLKIWK